MRRAIVILLTSLLSGFLAAQVYFPMPDSAARWRTVSWLKCDSAALFPGEFVISDSATGDTIIGGLQYTKIERIRCDWCGIDTSCPAGYCPATLGYRGAIRDDSAARKVWIRLPGYAYDSLLFDFSLSLGDTMRSYITNNYDYVVTFVTTYTGGGFPLRELALNRYWDPLSPQIDIVEGVGNRSSGLEPVQKSNVQPFALHCFQSPDLSVYECEFCCGAILLSFDCDFHVVSDENPTSTGGIQLVPSIGDGHFQINWNGWKASELSLRIITPSGLEVHNSELDRNQKELDLSMLPSGMYWVEFVGTSDSYQFQKIIVIH